MGDRAGDGGQEVMLLALLLAPLLTGAQPPASPAETPKAWMEQVYASYRDPDFSPFKHPDRYFAPALLAAINEDSRLAKGEVGYSRRRPDLPVPGRQRDAAADHPRHPAIRRQASVEVLIDWVDFDRPQGALHFGALARRVAHRRRRLGRRTKPAAGAPAGNRAAAKINNLHKVDATINRARRAETRR